MPRTLQETLDKWAFALNVKPLTLRSAIASGSSPVAHHTRSSHGERR